MIPRRCLLLTVYICLIAVVFGETLQRKNGNSSESHHSRMQRYHAKAMNTVSQAQISVDCDALMKPIKAKRNACLANSTTEVDICVYFAADYNYVIPFLIHHLSLGASHIWIYNNDEKTAWYKHPAVQCLMEDNYVDIQPWFGENGLHIGLDHCFERRIPSPAHRKDKDLSNVWGAVFDIDELFVLHEDTCMNKFVEKRPAAPSIAVNWAFFTPEVPLNAFSRTGNPAYMTEAHYEEIKRSSGIAHIENDIILPHDMLLRRMFENQHVKSITRHTCAGKWTNEHCAGHKNTCTFGSKPVDPQGHFIDCSAFTPWVDNYYPVAQLNHYWTLSLADFLRKIHRGKGGSYSRNFDGSRNTGEFFAHGTVTRQPFVNDTSFHKYYGKFFNELKKDCPRCFDTSLYHL